MPDVARIWNDIWKIWRSKSDSTYHKVIDWRHGL